MNRVTQGMLEALVGPAETKPEASGKASGLCLIAGGNGTNHRLKVEDWLKDRSVKLLRVRKLADGDAYDIPCPFNADHAGTDCAVLQYRSGKLGAKCFHSSCAGRKWADFRDKIGKPEPHHYDPPLPPPGQKAGADNQSGPDTLLFRWEAIDSPTFFAADYRPKWLVKRAVVEGQPLVIGAPQKTLKTSLAVDMAISLATATPWLGEFACPARRRVAVLSGESGPFTLQETALRICRAKAVEPAGLGDFLHWQFRLPQLAVLEQLDAMRAGLEKDRIEVVIVDPLYLSLLAGSEGIKAENLFDTGPLLLRVAQVCQSVGATPILLHHTTKPAARKLEPLELTDLAFSGIAEFSRQWILLSRREAYEPGSGRHNLWMVVGGSMGHGGLYAVDVVEGELSEDFGGRKWEVAVKPGHEARADDKENKQDAKAEAARRQAKADDGALLAALDKLAPGGEAVGYKIVQARTDPPLSDKRMSLAFERLIADRIVKRVTVQVTIGNNAKREATGIQRTSSFEEEHHRVAMFEES